MAVNPSMPSESSPVVDVGHENSETIVDVKNFQEEDNTLQRAGATFLRTCFNGLNALSGVGILSTPYALAAGGWLSFAFLFAIAATCCYTGLLLKRCMSKNPSMMKTFPDIGDFAFGQRGRIATSVILYAELYLVAVGFLILEGDNLNKLFPGASLHIGALAITRKQLFVLLAALIILPSTWLRNMSLLAFVSAGGVLASLVLVGAVLFSSAFDVGFHERGRLLRWEGLPTALGLYAFCYNGHAVFPSLCTSMRDKAKFSKVMLICFVLCTVNYASMAVFGYLTYGDEVKSQVTLNLPVEKISSQIAISTTLINPLAKYALMTEPLSCAIEKTLGDSKGIHSYIVRTLMVVSTAVVALSIPFFGLLMAFVGSLLSVLVSILLPCACYVKIFQLQQIRVIERFFIGLIVVLGFLTAVLGTYSSVKKIFQSL